MKKRLLGILVFILCMTLCTAVALADEIKVDVTATPTELSESGMVTFTFEISNYTGYELSDITITYLEQTYDASEGYVIPPNGSMRNVLELPVSDAQLGKPISFIVSYTHDGEPINKQAQITIARAADPVITVTRTASATMARAGETITLTYTLKNETKFDMSDITLIDENISDNPILEQNTLHSNDSFSLDRVYTMGTDSVVSTPLVTYTVNGRTKTYSAIEPMTLTMLLVQLNMSIDAGTPTAAGVNFTIDVKNTGNQQISNISITDERLNAVNEEPFSLAAGESTTYSFHVVPLMTGPIRNVSFLLNGTDEMGAAYTLSSSKAYEVYPFVDDSQISVTARAETVTPWSNTTAAVDARMIVTNHSLVELKNITLMETTIGVLKTIDVLPAGETVLDLNIPLGSPRNLQFTLKGYDPTGVNRELVACMLPVAYGTATDAPASPTAAPETQVNTNVFNSMTSMISRILLVLGVLLVIAFIALIVLSLMDRGRMDRYRFDSDEDEADEELADEIDRAFRQTHVNYDMDPEQEREAYFTRRVPKPRVKDAKPSAAQQSAPIPLPPARIAERAETHRTPIAYEYETDAADSPYAPPKQSVRPVQPAAPIYPVSPVQYEPPAQSVQPPQTVSETTRTGRIRPQTDAQFVYEHRPQPTAPSRVQGDDAPARPVRAPAAPSTPEVNGYAPRAFDYKKQPKVVPQQKQAVVHVRPDERNGK